ncbi:MAG TPA: phosphoenolpyruvate-utilizing N-terminal domain-containing protein, partial [Pirellulales bacterium]
MSFDPSLGRHPWEKLVETNSATIDRREQAEVRLSGNSIAPGLGMGRAWVVGDLLQGTGTPQAISQNGVADELVRLQHSFQETLAQLDEYAQRIESEFDSTLAGVFRAHGEMLRDLFTSGEFERELRTSLIT